MIEVLDWDVTAILGAVAIVAPKPVQGFLGAHADSGVRASGPSLLVPS